MTPDAGLTNPFLLCECPTSHAWSKLDRNIEEENRLRILWLISADV